MNEQLKAFHRDRERSLETLARDDALRQAGKEFVERSMPHRYSYNFDWLGRPVIQHPEDLVAMQEIVFRMRPDIIVETGVAHGGSLIFYASLCRLFGHGHVVGIDIDIRAHNREALDGHFLREHITLIEGSSTDPGVVGRVREMAAGKRVLVVLDSNHTHEHVLNELRLYSPLARRGDYLVVFDTVVEILPDELCEGRPWSRGNSPMTAVREFLAESGRFEVDREMENKLIITMAPQGYLRCIAD